MLSVRYHIRFIVVAAVAAIMLAGPSAAFAETPQEALDAAIAEAERQLGQIDFTGVIDPEKLLAGLREGLTKVKSCDTSGLGKIKLALIGLMENRLYLTLRDIRDGKAGTGNSGILARELLRELFGDGKSAGIIKRYKERCEYLDLFPALERAWQAHTGGAFSSFTSAQIADYFDRNLWSAVQESSEPWAKAMRELGNMRKLLALLMDINALHKKIFSEDVQTPAGGSGGTAPTAPKVPLAGALPKLLNNVRMLSSLTVSNPEVYVALNQIVAQLSADATLAELRSAHQVLNKLAAEQEETLRKVIRNFPDLGNAAVRYFKAWLEYYLYMLDQRSGTEAPTGKVPPPPPTPEEGRDDFGAFRQGAAPSGSQLALVSPNKGARAALRVLTFGNGTSSVQPQRVLFYRVPSSG